MNLVETINFKSLGDLRGDLVSLESHKDIPFEIKRIYYIFGTKLGVSRGFHAHKNLKQMVVCLAGSCKFILDDGEKKEEVTLNSPLKGVLINEILWREMHDFSEDCILMVIANGYYDEDDYIRNYNDFLNEIRLKNEIK